MNRKWSWRANHKGRWLFSTASVSCFIFLHERHNGSLQSWVSKRGFYCVQGSLTDRSLQIPAHAGENQVFLQWELLKRPLHEVGLIVSKPCFLHSFAASHRPQCRCILKSVFPSFCSHYSLTHQICSCLFCSTNSSTLLFTVEGACGIKCLGPGTFQVIVFFQASVSLS